MKYMAIVDDEFISNFRVDIKSDSSHIEKVLVVTDQAGATRAIKLKPLSTESVAEKEKSAKWITLKDEWGDITEAVCSNCDYNGYHKWHYCPNCGCNMIESGVIK